jgi:biopolymer transport protein ExbB/TolQ
MSEFISLSGPWGIVLTALLILIVGLIIWSSASLFGSGEKVGPKLKNRINAILFWGACAAVIGLLGQANGIYLALRAISRASEISPPIVMEGFAISFLTTIMGLLLLLVSALAWWGLRSIHTRKLGTLVSP